MKADKITIETFTKLFDIKIVANKRLGLLSNESIKEYFFDLLLLTSFNCKGVSEKKATSEPEIMAEKNNNNISIINAIIILAENVFIMVLETKTLRHNNELVKVIKIKKFKIRHNTIPTGYKNNKKSIIVT